jgi:hypothetical protein
MTCQEAELLLGEAECRAAAANASSVAQQDDIMQVGRASKRTPYEIDFSVCTSLCICCSCSAHCIAG